MNIHPKHQFAYAGTMETRAAGSGDIDVRDVGLRFGAGLVALENIDLQVESGRFVAIVGPSGCGKSSLLQILGGLIRPSGGTVLCGGSPMDGPDPDRIGIVFQESSLYPWLTAQKNVEFPLTVKGHSKRDREERAREALRLVGLSGFESRYPHELSGGMKQRVSIARGLVQNPPVLLMDEPFAALDEQTRIVMGDELLRVWDRTRKTLVFVTHGLSEAVYLSDEVIVMSGRPGRIIDRIEIALPRPRTFEMMSTPIFNELRQRIWEQIEKPGSAS
jgi:NitT/TauT family transport system ATP-binding protein